MFWVQSLPGILWLDSPTDAARRGRRGFRNACLGPAMALCGHATERGSNHASIHRYPPRRREGRRPRARLCRRRLRARRHRPAPAEAPAPSGCPGRRGARVPRRARRSARSPRPWTPTSWSWAWASPAWPPCAPWPRTASRSWPSRSAPRPRAARADFGAINAACNEQYEMNHFDTTEVVAELMKESGYRAHASASSRPVGRQLRRRRSTGTSAALPDRSVPALQAASPQPDGAESMSVQPDALRRMPELWEANIADEFYPMLPRPPDAACTRATSRRYNAEPRGHLPRTPAT